MTKNGHKQARQVQWLSLDGQPILLGGRDSDKITVTVSGGAVTIMASECILTECATSKGKPQVKRVVDELHITIPLTTCRIDWK